MSKPGQRRRQRLGLIMVTQRRKLAPTVIPAANLYDSRREHQAKQQPPKKTNHQLRRTRRRRKTRKDARWPKKHCQKSGFQQEHVPLIGEKQTANRKEGEIKHPKGYQGDLRRNIAGEHQRNGRSGPTQEQQKAIVRANPAKSRQLKKAPPVERLLRFQELGGGKYAASSCQTANLD